MAKFPGPTTQVLDDLEPNSKACQHVTTTQKKRKEKEKPGERMVDWGGPWGGTHEAKMQWG